MIDFFVRAENKAAWDAFALEKGWVGEDGLPVEGVWVDELGPVEQVPAVYDAGGNVIIPAVMDDWWHVNLRLTDDPLAETDTPATPAGLAHHMATGRKVTASPKNTIAMEGGEPPNRVQVLYPDSIMTPRRIWIDGMNFREL